MLKQSLCNKMEQPLKCTPEFSGLLICSASLLFALSLSFQDPVSVSDYFKEELGAQRFNEVYSIKQPLEACILMPAY